MGRERPTSTLSLFQPLLRVLPLLWGKRKSRDDPVPNLSLLLPTPYQTLYLSPCRCFEVYPDPVMQEVTHFCLPGLLPILKNTVQFVSEVCYVL